MTHCACCALYILLTTRFAFADYDTHLYAGPLYTPFWKGTSLTVAGETVDEGASSELAIELGVSRNLIGQRFALHGTMLYGSGWSSWSSSRGETRGHFDVTVAPELRFPIQRQEFRGAFRVGAPFGYSKAFIRAAPGRAVREDYGGGHGIAFGFQTGFDMWVPDSIGPAWARDRIGGYLGLAYMGRINWFDHEATLIAEPAVRVIERYRFTTRTLMFSLGIAFRY